MKPSIVKLEKKKKHYCVLDNPYSFKVGKPYLYILQDSTLGNHPLYIGETGNSKQYTVVGRIQRHFHTAESSTMNRLYKNMNAFGHEVPHKITSVIFELPKKYNGKHNASKRQSLEGWVVFLICHDMKIQDKRFAVTKYSSPTRKYGKADAEVIISKYRKCA